MALFFISVASIPYESKEERALTYHFLRRFQILYENLNLKLQSREFTVPEQAISGLRNALITCNRSPKQIQHEADQLSEVLLHRRFPAPPSVVREARNKVKNMLKEKEEQDMFRNEIDKILKKAHFTWQPLSVETKETAAAYALSQLAPNYAEISRVLDEFKGSTFCPDSVLDYGCGIGAGFWAVNERYGSAVNDYCMVDPSVAMTNFAMDIMRWSEAPCNGHKESIPDDKGNLLPRNINFRRHLPTSLQTKYDLVIAHRTLCEVDSRKSRLELVTSLWKRTNRFLVLIDSGLHDAFEALMEARDFLLLSGVQLHLEDTVSLLKVRCFFHNLMTENIYNLPAGIVLPTALPPAKIYAPCPHDLGCPKLISRSSCTFTVRWRVIRADGKHAIREISGTETRKFSFVIIEKCSRLLRLLSVIHFFTYFHIRHSDGHVTCDLCTSFNGIQRMAISRRAGTLYRWARGRRDGEIFPLQTKDAQSSFDLSDLLEKRTE
uniref:Methyltransferase-like protein 17, mitochondrial n=1 Tax=Angiostrongylus cantonensis TaxID=6313 RepID=A0A0K0D9Z1_ANGCA